MLVKSVGNVNFQEIGRGGSKRLEWDLFLGVVVSLAVTYISRTREFLMWILQPELQLVIMGRK